MESFWEGSRNFENAGFRGEKGVPGHYVLFFGSILSKKTTIFQISRMDANTEKERRGVRPLRPYLGQPLVEIIIKSRDI